MLEKVMELHFLLYAMMLMGGLGALGMLTTHLTYRRMIRKNTEVKSNLKEKWTNLCNTEKKPVQEKRYRKVTDTRQTGSYGSTACLLFSKDLSISL